MVYERDMEKKREPRNPRFREEVARVFAQAPFICFLGIRLVEVQPQYCAARVQVAPDHLQHLGRVHGGVLSSLAGHAALGAALSVAEEGAVLVSPEFTFQLLRPVRSSEVVCEARVTKAGAQLIFTRTLVYDGEPGQGRVVAQGTFTFVRGQ